MSHTLAKKAQARRTGAFVVLAALGCASSRSPGPSATNDPTHAPPATGDPEEAVAKAALARFVAADRDRLRVCYSAELARDPRLEDKMAVVVYVTPSGKVAEMTLVPAGAPGDDSPPSPLLSEPMAQCLAVTVMRWAFPALDGWHGTAQVRWRPPFLARWTPPPPNQMAQHKAMIRREIDRHNGEMQACYEAYLARAPRKSWDVRLWTRFAITGVGSVAD